MECPKCNQDADFQHLHDQAYGIPGTHMHGSERYQCVKCGHSLYKSDGEKLGLRFVFDRDSSKSFENG